MTAAASPGDSGQASAAGELNERAADIHRWRERSPKSSSLSLPRLSVFTSPATTSAASCPPRPPTRSLVPASIQPRFYKQTSPRVNEGNATPTSPDSKVEQLIMKHFVTLTREISSLRGEVKDTREELKKLQTTRSSLEEDVNDIDCLVRSVEDDVSHIRGDTTQIRDDLWQMKGVMLADVRAVREMMRRLSAKIDAQGVGTGHAQQQQRGAQDVRDLIQELGARLEQLEGRLPTRTPVREGMLGGGRPAVHEGGPNAVLSRYAMRAREFWSSGAGSAPNIGNHHNPAGSAASSPSGRSRDPLDALAVPAVPPPSRRAGMLGQVAPPAKRLRTSSNQDASGGAGEGSTSNTRSAAEDFIARAIRGGRSSDAGRLGGMRRMS